MTLDEVPIVLTYRRPDGRMVVVEVGKIADNLRFREPEVSVSVTAPPEYIVADVREACLDRFRGTLSLAPSTLP